jgi:hypothetical protein
MDYVTDAKPLLKKMERNGIGLKRASFYMAYDIMRSTRGSIMQRRCTIWESRSKLSS